MITETFNAYIFGLWKCCFKSIIDALNFICLRLFEKNTSK